MRFEMEVKMMIKWLLHLLELFLYHLYVHTLPITGPIPVVLLTRFVL